MPLSKAALMREKRAAGMSVGDIGRLFNVTYHYAYQVVVVHAGRSPRGSAANPLLRRPQGSADLAALTWPELLTVTEGPARSRGEKLRRAAFRGEADVRLHGDPTGDLYTQEVETWTKEKRPAV